MRVLRPAGSDEALPVVLYLHGLGWMLTDAYAHRHLVTDLVLGADAAVVVPEYDVPDDVRYPAAVERAQVRYPAVAVRRYGARGRACGR
ncbi:alpha/beta hydrolase fold domain-containing protein [Streptomyces sp. NPDC046881]|uniref:alpha/beta hydrolase n=1 Tax=Streptomyces sp. NPDC046881 TaxID=3155374 RepID=UPI0033DCED8C